MCILFSFSTYISAQLLLDSRTLNISTLDSLKKNNNKLYSTPFYILLMRDNKVFLHLV